MIAKTNSASVLVFDAYHVDVEVDVSIGSLRLTSLVSWMVRTKKAGTVLLPQFRTQVSIFL